MATCRPGSLIPLAGADATSWVSVTCKARDFYAPQPDDDDDKDWLTETAQGQAYLASAVILGVLCVVLVGVIWHYRKALAKGPQRLEDDGL